jgi:hypothetical protein
VYLSQTEEKERTMFKKPTIGLLAMLICIPLSLQGLALPVLAKTKVSPGAEIKADEKAVHGILASFQKAEEFLDARNLDGLMGLYSKDYYYNALKKDDVRKIWEGLLAQHHRIASSHMFTKIVVVDGKHPTAEITCTGSLWATADPSGKRENIDSWFEEVHHMVYENGEWRITGQVGEHPRAPEFGVAPHPLF